MLIKVATAFAIIVGTVSGALAQTRPDRLNPTSDPSMVCPPGTIQFHNGSGRLVCGDYQSPRN